MALERPRRLRHSENYLKGEDTLNICLIICELTACMGRGDRKTKPAECKHSPSPDSWLSMM